MPDAWPWGIAAACFGVAIAATIKSVHDAHALKMVQKQLDTVSAELAALKKAQDKESGAGRDKPPPISYPPSGKVT